MSDPQAENVKGTAKEMAGKVTGSDEMVREGQAQQERAEAEEQARRAEQEQERHSGT